MTIETFIMESSLLVQCGREDEDAIVHFGPIVRFVVEKLYLPRHHSPHYQVVGYLSALI